MRKPLIAGNWKMNKTLEQAEELVQDLIQRLQGIDQVEIAICPPAVNLAGISNLVKDTNLRLGAQNMYWEESGAYTGEISAPMLKTVGVNYVIIGHSERREYFAETDQEVNRKVKAAFKAALRPIVCVGETLAEREQGQTRDKVREQVKAGLAGLTPEQLVELVIAYEPIWAIGTGKTASAEEANQVIAYIRRIVRSGFGASADLMRIQYGGSVKPDNIVELMTQPEIDGALVGGASLDPDSFTSIVRGAL
ncbi:MAG: triose-phosphate isomerase [Halanaerobiales bacterium]|nr:triose-phosphate isomerase [Halanaerobiales bacterium]